MVHGFKLALDCDVRLFSTALICFPTQFLPNQKLYIGNTLILCSLFSRVGTPLDRPTDEWRPPAVTVHTRKGFTLTRLHAKSEPRRALCVLAQEDASSVVCRYTFDRGQAFVAATSRRPASGTGGIFIFVCRPSPLVWMGQMFSWIFSSDARAS